MSAEKQKNPEGVMKLVVWKGNTRGREYLLQEGSNLIGRWDPDSGAFPEIDLEGEDQEAKVSRKHALIECRGKSVTVLDLGSRNGTFINRGAKLVEGTRYNLNPGDEVVVGKVFLRFEKD